MKSILVIGLGRFGRHLCRKFQSLGNDVMIVDENEAAVTALASEVTNAQIADCTNEAVLRELGVANFDLCCVCIGSDFTASLLIVSMLRDLGAKRIIAKAAKDIEAKLLLRNGADEVVYPERDSAESWAVRLSAGSVFDYIELTEDYSIYEIPPLTAWLDKSIRQLDIRNKYHANILGVKYGEKLFAMPSPDYVFTGSEHVLALAKKTDAPRLLRDIESGK